MPRPLMLLLSCCAAAVLMITGITPSSAAPPGGAENGSRLMAGVALYPRVIRLQHSGPATGRIIASAVTFDSNGAGIGAIFASTDHGRSFQRIGSVTDPYAAQGLCCSTLYELPRRVGKLSAGTLLWSASVGQGAAVRRMTLPVWASSDHGRTWRKLGTVATSPNDGGLWEPEFTVSRDGRLVLFVSDESQQPTHSQTLVASISTDGGNWSPLRNVVAADDPALRPGMPVVRRLPHGDYLMSYEICGPGEGCRQRIRRSADGIDWGDPADLGTLIDAADGTGFRHAPTISWYADGSRDGALLSVGQMLYDSAGAIAEGNGSTIMSNNGRPEAAWTTAEAPVRIAAPYDNYCPNYSSSLLPMPESGRLLELATGYDADGVCTTYFGTGNLPHLQGS